MDECASVLLGFPPDQDLADDEQYDKAVKAHIQRVGRLLKEQPALVSANADQLLDVSSPRSSQAPILTVCSMWTRP